MFHPTTNCTFFFFFAKLLHINLNYWQNRNKLDYLIFPGLLSPCRPCFLMGSCRPLSTSLQTRQMSLAFGVASGFNVEGVGGGLAGKRLHCATSEPAAKRCWSMWEHTVKDKLLHGSSFAGSDWRRLRAVWLWSRRQTVWLWFTWENVTSFTRVVVIKMTCMYYVMYYA